MDKNTNATRYEDILKNIEHAERRVNKFQLDLNLATLGLMKLRELKQSITETDVDKPDKLTEPEPDKLTEPASDTGP